MIKHEYDVSALSWLPDGQGFVSGGMDSDVLFWVRVLPREAIAEPPRLMSAFVDEFRI